jgi:DNA replication protein DnaC
MLVQPLLDKLSSLKLAGMREGLREQMENSAYRKLSFEERLGMLLDHEWDLRQTRKQTRRMRVARFREVAVIEDLDFSVSRGLDRSQVLALTQEDWIRQHLNIIITGPTGAGKTYLACALGQSACRNGVSVRYFQISKLLQKIIYARADGSSLKLFETLAKTQLLVIDDWLRNPLTECQTPDLLEILEDRYGRASTILATQIPVADWHDRLGNATLSDAVMDRIIHNAHRLELKGESMRKRRCDSDTSELLFSIEHRKTLKPL